MDGRQSRLKHNLGVSIDIIQQKRKDLFTFDDDRWRPSFGEHANALKKFTEEHSEAKTLFCSLTPGQWPGIVHRLGG